MKKAAILGGTGQIGVAVADHLLNEGWQVSLVSRGIQPIPQNLVELGVTSHQADRYERAGLQQAIGSGCDLLFDAIAFDDDHARHLLEVQDTVGQIIAVSSASVYRDEQGRTLDEARDSGFPELPLRMTEEQPTVEPGPSTYSTRKIAMEQTLLDGAKVPVALLRPCAIHGPFSTHPREWWFVKRLTDGRETIPLAYKGESRFQTSATVNIAELVSVIASSQSAGVFNVADADAPTVKQIGDAIMNACAAEATLRLVDTQGYPPSELVGLTPWSIPRAFTISNEKAESLGYAPVGTYAETIGASCAWLMAQKAEDWTSIFPQLAIYPFNLFDYAAEDNFFARSAFDNEKA